MSMEENNKIQLFEGKQVRYVWDAEKEKYFFSVVDVIKALTDSENPRRYWSDLKRKLQPLTRGVAPCQFSKEEMKAMLAKSAAEARKGLGTSHEDFKLEMASWL